MALRLEGATLGYRGGPVVHAVDLELPAGGFVGLIGPNASGKSTLLKAMSRVLQPLQGRATLDGEDLWRLPSMAVARRVAAVAQGLPPTFPLLAQELVLMGRLPHLRRFQGEGPRDLAVVRRALTLTGTLPLADRSLAELSGGERQRLSIARALAQEPKYLLLDEPTAHLDINYKVELLDLLRRLNRAENLAVLVILHDLNLAALYCDQLVLLRDGRVHVRGSPEAVLLSSHLQEVYGSHTVISRHPIRGVPQVTLVPGRDEEPVVPSRGDGRRVHLVGGGGSAAWLLEALALAGFVVTAGALNRGDSDWVLARSLGLEVVEAAPFSAVGDPERARALELMRAADWVVLADVAVGRGNLPNLEAVRDAMQAGGRVIVVEATPWPRRDFTGGAAAPIYAAIREGAAAVVTDDRAVLERLAATTRESGR
ncbi:MAG TPA: ABC transporter ATP-binding protein [Bacillota bacterium]|nr:ABC transporter ATP-binding protein [Bacillota bacterium]